MKRILFFMFILILLAGCAKKETNTKKETPDGQLTCTVQLIEGQVTFLNNKNAPETLQVGASIGESWTITTGEESFAELLVAGRTLVRVKPLSMIKLSQLLKTDAAEKAKVQLFSGQVLTKSEKLPESATFEIATQTITTGIRGTTYEVTEADGTSQVAVEEGQVAVRKNYKVASLDKVEEKDKALAENLNQSIYQEELVNSNEKLEVKKDEFEQTEKELNSQVDEINQKLDNKEAVQKEEISEVKAKSSFQNKSRMSDDDRERIRSDKELMETRIDQEDNEISYMPVFIVIKSDIKTRFTVYKNGRKFRKVRGPFQTMIASDKITEFRFSSGEYPDQTLTVDPASFKENEDPVVVVEFNAGSVKKSPENQFNDKQTISAKGKTLIGVIEDKGKMGLRSVKFPSSIQFSRIILLSLENTTEITYARISFPDDTKLKLKDNFIIEPGVEYPLVINSGKPIDKIWISFKNKMDNSNITRIEVYGSN